MKTIFEKHGGTYTLGEDGIYYPDIILEEKEVSTYGRYGMLRKTYLKEHRNNYYQLLIISGKLVEHLNQIDAEANEKVDLLVSQLAKKYGVDEKLKAADQMKWVGMMNNLKTMAEETVMEEIVNQCYEMGR